ncbi:MAG: VWA domain-containing protein [Candidatus Kapabacteria bacterium]|nr:VWA domain-containing protein [Candidatus Kapabacteria bacterium]
MRCMHALFVRTVSDVSALVLLALTLLPVTALSQGGQGMKILRHQGLTLHASEIMHNADSTILQVVVVDSVGNPVRSLDCDPTIGCGEEIAAFWAAVKQRLVASGAYVRMLRVQEHAAVQTRPHAIGFVLDHSPSMTTPRAIRMQRAVHAALGQLVPGDAVTVVKFTADVNVEVPITTDHEEARRRFKVSGLNPKFDGTAIHDAIIRGIDELSQYADSRVLFVFTDGEDNSSRATLDSVIHYARRTRTTIHIITYGMDDVSKLTPLATATGGCVHELTDVYDLDQLFTARYAALRWYYTVTAWHPSDRAYDHAGAVLTMEGAHATDRPLLDVVGRFSGTAIELLHGVSDAASLVLRLPRTASDAYASGEAFEGLDALAAVLRAESDLAVEVLRNGTASERPEAMTSTFEQLRVAMERRGVEAQQIMRGATVEDRFGSALKADGTSLYLVLYRP